MKKLSLGAAVVLTGVMPALADDGGVCIRTFKPPQAWMPKTTTGWSSAYGPDPATCTDYHKSIGVVTCGKVCVNLPVQSTITDMKSMLTRGPGTPWPNWYTTVEGNPKSIPSWSWWNTPYGVVQTANVHRVCREAVNWSTDYNLAAMIEITVRMDYPRCVN